jgi:hypothetical protein
MAALRQSRHISPGPSAAGKDRAGGPPVCAACQPLALYVVIERTNGLAVRKKLQHSRATATPEGWAAELDDAALHIQNGLGE